MKKRGKLKGIILAALLVIGLTSIVSFVSASEPIATIEYAGKIVDISGDNPQIQVDLHEFGKVTTDLNVEFKISEYKEAFAVKLFSPNGGEINMAEPSYEDGIIHVDLSNIMNSVEKGVYGIYSLQFQEKESEEVDFKVQILVDKKDPIIEVYLDEQLIKTKEDIKDAYNSNKLLIKVKDENFDPNNDKGSYSIPGTRVSDWELVQDDYIAATFELLDGENRLNISVTDAAGNKFVFPYSERSFIVDTEGPEINVSIENQKIDPNQIDPNKDYYINKEKLTVSIKDKLHKLNLKDTKVSVNDVTYSLDEDGNLIDLPLVNGEVSINIKAYDSVGNKSEFNISNLIIDTIAPTIDRITFNNKVLGERYFYDESQRISIEINEKNFEENGLNFELFTEELNQQIGTIEWKHDGTIHTATFTPQDGEYKFSITATDKAQNKSDEQFLSFMIDTVAPEITVTGIEEAFVYPNASPEIIVNDANFESAEYTLVKNGQELLQKKINDSELVQLDVIEEGQYVLNVVATDKAGRESSQTITFVIDTTNPIIGEIKYEVPTNNVEGILYFKEDNKPTFRLPIKDLNIDSAGIELEITKDGESYTEEVNWTLDTVEESSQISDSSEEVEWTHMLNIPFTEDGTYELTIKNILDKAGNRFKESIESINFVIDTENPKIEPSKHTLGKETQEVIITIQDDTFKEISYSVYKTDYVNGINKEPYLDEKFTRDEVEVDEESSYTFKFSLEETGTYEIELTVTDLAGNTTFIGKDEHIFTADGKPIEIDKELPDIKRYEVKGQINPDGDKNTYYLNTETSINLEVYDYNFDTATTVNYEYKSLTGDTSDTKTAKPQWEKTKDYTYKATIPIEEDGYYTLKELVIKDLAGNESKAQPNIEKVVIDRVTPEIREITGVKENGFYYKDGNTVTINVSIDEENYNPNQSTYEIYCKETLNSEEKLYRSGNITSQTDFKLPPLSENGEYRIVLKLTDLAGNEADSETLHFYIDRNKPTVSIKPLTTNTANGSQQNVSEVILALNATDDWKLAETKYTVKRNNEEYSAYEKYDVETKENLESFKLRFKEEGFYQVELQTNDEAGNGVVTQSFEFTIDRTSPAQLNIVGNANHHNANTVIADGGSYSAPRVNLNFAAQDLYSFDYMAVNVLRNGSSFAAQTFNLQEARSDFDTQFSKDVSYSLSEEGEYEVTFTAYDQAGNKNDQKVSFEIDRTAPVIDSNIEDGKYYNSDFLPEFNLDQPDRDEFTFINIDDTNYKGRVPVLASDKVYTISALATDKAQNTTDYYATLTVDKTPPAIGISNLISGFFKDTLSPSIFYNDTNLDSSTVSIKLNNVDLGPGVGDENGYTKEIAIDKDGTYSLEIAVGDLATNVSKQTIDFVLDNESPTVIIKNPITLYNQPWIPELEVLEEYGYDIVMVTLNGVEHDITQPITTEGKNVLFIEVMDKSGNVSSLTLQFILDLTPPKVIVEDAATNQLVKDGDRYLTNLDLKIYLDYVSQEGQEDTERITKISLNGEDVADSVTTENGRKVYRLSLTEFKDYTLEVTAVDDAQNKTVEVINFTLGDKDIFTKIYENKPVFYSLITITGLAVLGSGVYGVIVLKSKSKNKEDSSEE